MPQQVSAQTGHVAGIEQFHAAAKQVIVNAFVVWPIYLAGERRLLNVPFQSRPTRKSGLARNGQLRIVELQVRFKDLGIGRSSEARVKFTDPLRGSHIAVGVIPEQVFCLVFEVIEVGLWR
jgi:hypothetical protein